MIIERHDARSYAAVVPEMVRLYEDVYREPPYCETSSDAADFAASLPHRSSQPAFRLVTAAVGGAVVGFAFGHQLHADTKWWAGALDPFPHSVTDEYPRRTFAVIEIAVAPGSRRQGVARAMHEALLDHAEEQRATLLVRPEAEPARRAYEKWGYQRVGAVEPWPDAPVYDALIRQLASPIAGPRVSRSQS